MKKEVSFIFIFIYLGIDIIMQEFSGLSLENANKMFKGL